MLKNRNGAKKSLYSLLIVTIVMLAGLILWLNRLIAQTAVPESAPDEGYRLHYAMVVGSSDDTFWDMVYDGAQTLANEQGAYVELMQTQSTALYTLKDQLQMAFAAKVDGIFIVSDGSQAVESAIIQNARSEHPIPLLTVLEHGRLPGSFGFVGVDETELGLRYSALVQQLAAERPCTSLVMLTPSGAAGTISSTFDSLRDDLSGSSLLTPEQMTLTQADASNIFNCKRDIRTLLSREDAPDVLICPNYLFTISACQVAVEQNTVCG